MHPLTANLPKCLIDIGGRTLINRAVSILAAHGIRRFTIVDGFMGDMVREEVCAAFPRQWFRFERNAAYATTNNEVSLLMARYDDPRPMLLLDSDIIFEDAVIWRVLNYPHENRLALRTRGSVGEEDMKVSLGPDGRVVNIAKDVPIESCAGESVGIELFSAPFVQRLFRTIHRRVVVDGVRDAFYEAAFMELIRGGDAVYAVDLGDSLCVEVDTLEDLRLARDIFGEGGGA